MKIVIVTGIFEPESGGPATYAPRLAEGLVTAGDEVTVVTYSSTSGVATDADYSFRLVRVKRGNKILNRVRFFFAVLPHIAKSDCVYLLDWFAAGLPAATAARIYKKPYAVRIGGDYLWEQQYLGSGKPSVSLASFYERGFDRAPAYRAYRALIVRTLGGATKLVFNAVRMRDLYMSHYDLLPEKTVVIENPLPRIDSVERGDASSKEIVFWGRLIEMKNVATLIRAFAVAQLPEAYHLTIIGDGPQRDLLIALAADLGLQSRISFEPAMPRDQVLNRVRNARAFVLPSWTDISPNQVYEALAIGLPGLVTRENYLGIHDRIPEMIDPTSVEDIAAKLRMLADDASYERFRDAFRAATFTRTWGDVAREHKEIFNALV